MSNILSDFTMPSTMLRIIIPGIMALLMISGCSSSQDRIFYQTFADHSWNRFHKLYFEIPIDKVKEPYDIYLFARHSKNYEYDNLDFNMIMTTPSDEERIKEYDFSIKRKEGDYIGEFNADTCQVTIALKKGIYFSKPGILRIEIENLVPRMEVKGLFGIGIRVHVSR